MQRYNLQSDVNMRLNGSIVRFKGAPYYVRLSNDRELHVNLYPLDNLDKAAFKNVHSSDPDLDISAIPLGYVNTPDYPFPVYIARHCFRAQKQGTDNHNTISVFVNDSDLATREVPGIRAEFKHLLPAILGQYPTVDVSKLLSSKEPRGYAFHRKFALTTGGKGVLKLKYLWYTAGFTDTVGILHLIPPYNKPYIRNTIERESNGLFKEFFFIRDESVADDDRKAFEQA